MVISRSSELVVVVNHSPEPERLVWPVPVGLKCSPVAAISSPSGTGRQELLRAVGDVARCGWVGGGNIEEGAGAGTCGGGDEERSGFAIDMVKVGLPAPLPASELLQREKAEFFLACPKPDPRPPRTPDPAPRGEVPPSPGKPPPRSDMGLPSRELARLACDPPHALDRKRLRASMLMFSPASGIIANSTRPGLCMAPALPPALPRTLGNMNELRLEYSERSVIGVRFGSRDTMRPLIDRVMSPAGPKKPPLAYWKRFSVLRGFAECDDVDEVDDEDVTCPWDGWG